MAMCDNNRFQILTQLYPDEGLKGGHLCDKVTPNNTTSIANAIKITITAPERPPKPSNESIQKHIQDVMNCNKQKVELKGRGNSNLPVITPMEKTQKKNMSKSEVNQNGGDQH
ncbi:unnamed protein product [Lepeophtheirus salmonis]|uniref:(salmon louse) hypothetical protein n=1 Tax=Lepeophtheirus salmonis TaxID=72036 RepID=A0A7R8CTG8_LEPSM|nr:unnamed protein product [Lepeophtheirus salmonis]CAF2924290.1 unnamed protein product [Lepeophtheirus salmonis]